MTPTPDDEPPFPYTPVHPDLLAWAKQTFDMDEFMEGVREIQAGGGKMLDQFIAEVEAAACGSCESQATV